MNIINNITNRYNNAKQYYRKVTDTTGRYSEQTPVCMNIKDENGEIKQATLSKEARSLCDKAVKAYFGLFALSVLGCAAQYIDAQTVTESELEEHKRNLEQTEKNHKTAIENTTKKDSLIWDEKLPYPAKFEARISNPASDAGRFYSSLRENKDSLMKDLDISSERYNMLAEIALKIAGEESKLGNSKGYKAYNAVESYESGSQAVSTARKIIRGSGNLSLGMTRFKISDATSKEKELFDKYGITYENTNSNVIEPEKSAIATIIHLSALSEKYPTYLENIKAFHPDTTTAEAKEAIANAKRIIFDDKKRYPAILAVKQSHRNPKEDLSEERQIICDYQKHCNFESEYITEKDVEDLKFYAKTIELTEPAYLAALWNGQKLIPNGNEEVNNNCYKSLLNIAAQKGYVSNIDKSTNANY